jgi:hypothetical protein
MEPVDAADAPVVALVRSAGGLATIDRDDAVDLVLPVDQIAGRLIELTTAPLLRGQAARSSHWNASGVPTRAE